MNQDYSNSCRFCLNFVEIFDRIEITEKIREQFQEAVNIDLSKSIFYPEFYCIQCSQELQICLSIKGKFAANQKLLEEIFKPEDQDDFDFVHIKTEDLDENEIDVEPGTFRSSYSGDEDDDLGLIYENSEFIKRKLQKQKKGKSKSIKKQKSENTCGNKKQNIRRVPCKVCGLLFRTDSVKKHYERMHLKIRSFQCDHCAKSFFKKSEIEQHIKMHQNAKDEICPKCGLRFRQKGSLRVHITMKHENHIQTCHYCGKIYNTKTKLDGHIRSKHTLERKYQCPVEGCEKAYFTCGDMIKHKKLFHKENEICPICSAEVKHLKNHMKRHEMKFVCDQYDKGQICNKRFADSFNLREHIDVQHLGIRKFSCTLCDGVFSKNPVLQNHIRTVHQSKRIQCELCSTLITRKDYYRKHVLDNHRELDDVTKELLLEKIRKTKDDDLFNYQK